MGLFSFVARRPGTPGPAVNQARGPVAASPDVSARGPLPGTSGSTQNSQITQRLAYATYGPTRPANPFSRKVGGPQY